MALVTEKLIDQIFSEITEKYTVSREKLRAKYREAGKNLLFVHEICECSEKRKMRLRFPELERAEVYNARFVIGELIEEALKKRFKNEGDSTCMKELNVDGKQYIICGTVDIIDPESKTLIEVKYQTALKDEPKEHHVLQLRLYLWLLGAEKGELLYVSPEGLKSFIIEKPLAEREIAELIKSKRAPRWVEWECKYCQYQPFCNKAIIKHR